MKKYAKYIMLAVAFVAVIALSIVGYNYLSKKYSPDQGNDDTQNGDADKEIVLAADFTVIDTSGNTVKLSDFFGKPIIINFWASWCGPCRSELPAFDNLYQQNKDEIVFLMVNLTDGYRDTINGVKNFVSTNEYSFPVFFDTAYSASNAYNVSGIPVTVFINAEGEAVKTHIGSMSEQTLTNYISNLFE